jgi:cytochrome oxidase Cu insertion factor (SCO1/SenC/PrrC family)
MKNLRLFALVLLTISSFAWGQGGNPPASTKESGETSGHGMTAVEQAQKQSSPTAPLKIGDLAPDFTLVDQNGQPHSLHDYKGKKNVALAFYV